MSIEEVDRAIHNLAEDDTLVGTPGFCRYAAERMAQVAKEADKTVPHAVKEILVYPEASTDEIIHYALKVSDPRGQTLVFNPCPTALFPQYLGDFKSAPGFIPQMKVTEKIL